jgi:5-methylcytosine-specific restriction protein A
MCFMCKQRGVDRVATVANHVIRHQGNYHLFWHGELNSLCAACHNSDQQRIESGGKPRPRGVGADGWPIE